MKQETVPVIVSLFAAVFLLSQTAARGQSSSCRPAVPPEFQAAARGAGQGPPPVRVSREVSEILGVVAAGTKWTKVWQQAGNSADGIIPDKDGSVLVAQEDYDVVLKIDNNGKPSVFVANAKGVGSVSMDRQGRLYGVHRTERPGSTKGDRESIVNAITILSPERKTIANKWEDGTPLTVRPNDLAADSQGGAYFTSGCVYYASSKGTVTPVIDNIRTNGIVFSPDDKILYVTNGGGAGQPGTIVAFDVKGPGMLSNRRDFAKLEAGGNGDGSAVDSQGRLYVTSNPGVQVFDKTGKYLGLIPTPRGVISVAFAGPDKKTLYVVGSGAEDDNGKPIREGPQQTAATVYKLPMIAEGVKGRAK